jgi:hypothetical protein
VKEIFVFEPEQIAVVPLILAVGKGFTVKETVFVAVHEFASVAVTV